MRARFTISLLLALGSIAGAAPALAGDGVTPELSSGRGAALPGEAEEPAYLEQSYLTDVIALDTTNLAFTIITAGFGSVITVPSYLLGAPALHAARGNRGQAALSLGVRAGLPVLGAVAGHALHERDQRHQEPCVGDDSIQCNDSPDGFDRVVAVATGAIVGATAAVVFDWVVLDHTERIPVQRSLVVVPQVSVGESGVSLGVLGSF